MNSPTVVEYGTCPACGYVMMPVPDLSPCGHPDVPHRAPMEAPGEVYSWSRVWSSPDESYLIAMADFLDGRLRVTAPLMGADQVAIGDRVRVDSSTDAPYALYLSEH